MDIKCKHCRICASGTDSKLYHLFMFQTAGTRNDQIGAKYFLFCPKCDGFICLTCGGIKREDLNFSVDPGYSQLYCPECSTRLYIAKMKNRSEREAGKEMLNFILRNENESEQSEEHIMFVNPGEIDWCQFNHGRLLKAEEGLEYLIRTSEVEIRLLHFRYPEPYSVILTDTEKKVIGRSDYFMTPGLCLMADSEGFLVGFKSGDEKYKSSFNSDRLIKLSVFKKGIVKGDLKTLLPVGLNLTLSRGIKDISREKIKIRLDEVNEKQIWDYQFINEQKTAGKGEIHIAGSTDLMYYHIVELYFKKVKFSNLISYFHHPYFELAEGTKSEMIKGFFGVEDDSNVFIIHADKGAFNERQYYIVAKRLFIEWMERKSV